ncbi:MAG: nuclear transport factor 2 family protein [Aridibacter famidurans]|nr:nuclear transport factor 2 family protein [Aridibacter famidurans]
MSKLIGIFVICFAVFSFTACPPPTENGANTGGNSGANDATTEKTLEATLTDLDKQAGEAWKSKNGQFFETFLTDNFVGGGNFGFSDKAGAVRGISTSKCDVKSTSTSEYKTVELSDSAAILAGKNSVEGTCEGNKIPEEYFATLYVKEGDSWKAAYYQSAAIPPSSDAKEEPAKEEGSDANAAKSPASEEKEAASEEAPPKPNIPNDAELAKTLIEMEKPLWDAWAKHDTKPFEDKLASNFHAVSSAGIKDRAAEIKWVTDHKCEQSSATLSGEKATKVNDDLVVLTYSAASKGTCEGQPMPNMYVTTIYQKDGDSWKPVLHFTSAEMKM